MSDTPEPGRIITFYSYKGGTGRSMALANLAWVLAMAGKRVLTIDWDFEAPGLHRYFHPFLSDPELTSTEGVIDFVIRFIEDASARAADEKLPDAWYLPYTRIARYANSIDYKFPGAGLLDFIPAGRQGEAYAARVNSLNWKHFYEKLGGWTVIERMREHLRSEYDFILVDSRTGVSDTAGICTIQLPDSVVVCFTLNFQSIDGASGAARSIIEQRSRKSQPVRLFPVPMRVELTAEKAKHDQVSEYALDQFLPTGAEQDVFVGADRRAYWDDVVVPSIAFYAFEEQLAWFQDTNRVTGVLAATLRLARYVADIDAVDLPAPSERERQEVLAQYRAVWAARLLDRRGVDHSRTCLVLMPFGRKEVLNATGTRRTIDFDDIYSNIFEPAIRATQLPEGGTLEPARADQAFYDGNMGDAMFRLIEDARFVIADITGLNPNVFYEIGIRHRAREAGTAIFRQLDAPIPFDISQIRAFPYETETGESQEESRELVRRVLTDSLRQNRIDSPVRRSSGQSAASRRVESGLLAAENALRVGDRPRAIAEYDSALQLDPNNAQLRLRLGLLLKDQGALREALVQFDQALATAPTYAEAWREKGIAEGKLYARLGGRGDLPDGIEALRRAVELNPADYDAFTSLGSALNRAGRLDEAVEAFARAVDLSSGQPYALLNLIALRVQTGRLGLDDQTQSALGRAERTLRAQVASTPPIDAPWSFFDLAQIRLFQNDASGFLDYARRGTEYASAGWQIQTFVDVLRRLEAAGAEFPGLREGIEVLTETARFLVASEQSVLR